jgi:hypothetical protein
MKSRFLIPFLTLALSCSVAHAQQTGVAIGTTPGSAVRNFPKAVAVPIPKASCNSPITSPSDSITSPALPDMVFTRESVVCVRHSDGRSVIGP